MTTRFHTPIPTSPNQEAAASIFNSRLSSLDTGIDDAWSFIDSHQSELIEARAGYEDLDARLDALESSGSNVSTNANGAASAGQKNITVDSTAGFLVNAPIAYTLVGGEVETNTIASITPTTVLTCANNIGAGGIPDNGFIMVITPGAVMSTGAVNGATAHQQRFLEGVFLGGNASLVGDDSALLIGRTATNPIATAGSHAVRDESAYNPATSGGYASFDANPIMTGANLAHNHLYSFQARPNFSGAGTLDALRGFTFIPIVSGSVQDVQAIYIANGDLTGATITNQHAGIYIDTLTTSGAGGLYGIYVVANNCYFGGNIQGGGTIVCSGTLRAENVRLDAATHSAAVGNGVPTSDLYYDTLFGFNAGHAMGDAQHDVLIGDEAGVTITTGDNNTIIGSQAGTRLTTGSGNIFLGRFAGSYETGSNKLFIDNQDRSTTEADARANAIVYGIMAAAKDNQEIQFNTGKMGFFGTDAVSKPTGVAVTAAGIHAALVTLGLIAA